MLATGCTHSIECQSSRRVRAMRVYMLDAHARACRPLAEAVSGVAPQFIFGYGVGGEYPLASSSAVSPSKPLHVLRWVTARCAASGASGPLPATF